MLKLFILFYFTGQFHTDVAIATRHSYKNVFSEKKEKHILALKPDLQTTG